MFDTGRPMRAVVMAGGKGTRLAPYTTVLPKPLIPIGEYPILEIIIRQLRHYGFPRITVTVGHLAHLIQAYFGDGSRFGVQIDYSLEEDPLGTAGPLGLIEGLDETFLVLNGDLLTTLDFSKLVSHHRGQSATLTIGLHNLRYQLPLGYVETNGSNRVTDYVEKPAKEYSVSMGVYVVEPKVLAHIEKGVKLDLPDLVVRLVQKGEIVIGYPNDSHWIDIGRPEEYERAVTQFEIMKEELLKPL